MPIYEYWCRCCQHRLALYLPGFSQSLPLCPECRQNSLTRLFSTFSVRKADKVIYEDILSDSHLVNGMLHNDPKALADWNKRMSRGEGLTPEYEEMVKRMEKGETPLVANEKKGSV